MYHRPLLNENHHMFHIPPFLSLNIVCFMVSSSTSLLEAFFSGFSAANQPNCQKTPYNVAVIPPLTESAALALANHAVQDGPRSFP